MVTASPRDDMTAGMHHAKVMLDVALNAAKGLLRRRSARPSRWYGATHLACPYEASVQQVLRAAHDDVREWSREGAP
jgi:hypothetical protein